MSENELLDAFRKNRSEEAFSELVKRHAGLVYSVAKRRLANVALAEDITQMVFIRLARAFPKVQNHAELAAWLHRTTIHVTIDTWRSENRRHNREQQAVIMEPATPENTIWNEIAPQLDEALNQLNDEDRQALLLRFFGEKTMRDVGMAMGVSEDAAKMRISRAVERLRTRLGVRNAAYSAVLLGAILAERSVEAAPARLVSRLAAIKLPAAAAGIGGLMGAWLRISGPKLVSGALVALLVSAVVVHQIRSSNKPVPEAASDGRQTNLTRKTGIDAGKVRPDLRHAGTVPTRTSRPVKMMFHVIDAETGRALAGTKIHAAYFGAGGEGESQDEETDSEGTVAISEPADPGKSRVLNVFVTIEHYVPRIATFRAQALSDFTMRLEPAVTATGWVIDEQGVPVAGAEIKMENPRPKPGKGSVDLNAREEARIGNAKYVYRAMIKPSDQDFQMCRAISSDDGSWNFPYVPRDIDEMQFIVRKNGFAPTFPVVPLEKAGFDKLVLVVVRGFVVTGQIKDSGGRPIAGARIRIMGGEPARRMSSASDENGAFMFAGVPGESAANAAYEAPSVKTNESGAFVIGGSVSRGPLHAVLVTEAEGFAGQSKTVELTDTTNAASFVLLPGNVFRGHVVNEAGQPIADAVVRTDFDFKNQIAARFDWMAHTDADGRFEWDSAPAEDICYWVEADGYEVIRGTVFEANGTEHAIKLTSKGTK